jgi:hypothetical protein
MSSYKAYVVLAALSLAAGCASAPQDANEPPAATPAATTNAGSVVPDTILDANELIARTPPPPICRDVLVPNSNVHETRCMSAESWKRWKQAEARNAARIVRMMQGSAYR